MLSIASNTFWPSARTPMTTSSEMEVAAVEMHPNYGAVENEPHDRLIDQRAGVPGVPVALHLAPDPTHRVLANGAAEHDTERTAHAARVGAGEVGAGDQRGGSQRAALVSSQRLALPLVVLPSGVFNLAHGTSISTRPKVPSSDLDRCPWR